MEWTNKIPTKDGLYWFYGELYRPLSERPKPRLELVKVRKISNGYAYISNGQFVSEGEGMQGLWQKAILPDTPNVWKYHWKENYYWCVNPQCNDFHKNWEIEWRIKLAEKDGKSNVCHYCYEPLELVSDDLSIFPNSADAVR